jgi:hypothetical protein
VSDVDLLGHGGIQRISSYSLCLKKLTSTVDIKDLRNVMAIVLSSCCAKDLPISF